MRLLFDQNLSPSLPRRLVAEFPDSLHVRELGLSESDDAAIWNYAREHGLTIVSKDSDFQQRSLLFGAPPKFIWLRIGNCSVAASAEMLRVHPTQLRISPAPKLKRISCCRNQVFFAPSPAFSSLQRASRSAILASWPAVFGV